MTHEARAFLLDFVLANTAPGTAPLVPEIRLRLANDVLPLWQRTEERATAHCPPPYWAFAWPGGQALARYILDHPSEFSGKSLLDFGAGSGLAAIAAAKVGATVSAAEIDPLAIAVIEANAAENHVAVTCILEDIIGSDEHWNIICFGDVSYERPLAERIRDWAAMLNARGARVVLGDPGRSYFSDIGAVRLASYDVPTSLDLEDRDMRTTSVYELELKG